MIDREAGRDREIHRLRREQAIDRARIVELEAAVAELRRLVRCTPGGHALAVRS
jgi:hypothetical protein